MSKENLVKLMGAAAVDEQLMQQLQSAGSYEEVKNLARQQGFDLGNVSEEDAARTFAVATGEINDELSDEELELVAGGFNIGMPPTLTKGFSFGVERKIAAQSGTGSI